MARTFLRYIAMAAVSLTVAVSASAQSLIRDAEIEETLREWTAPSARSIEVSLHETQEQAESVERVALPIGVLGDSSNLGSLEVRAQW